MNDKDFERISKELMFDKKDVKILTEILQELNKNIRTVEDIIKYWDNECFRADNIEEILDYYTEVEDINEIGDNIYILPSKILIVVFG